VRTKCAQSLHLFEADANRLACSVRQDPCEP
jgi:hypothetical protein